MDKMVTAVIAGTERQLNYSVEVMFDTAEKFGDIQSALDIVIADSVDGFEAVKWFAIRMANDAELCRRDAGYDPQPMLHDSDITRRIRPVDLEDLRSAVVDAIRLGYQREVVNENEEQDLGLEELQAKKAKAGE
jgi:hypothetical protein|nr:MAG TPA: hypothetical protein [Caudoviricetes sp.]